VLLALMALQFRRYAGSQVFAFDFGGSIRAAASQPGFLSAVLDHIAFDEPSLLAFAAEIGEAPETIAAARALLSGPSLWDTP
jgi:type IV secretion system protein VirB4